MSEPQAPPSRRDFAIITLCGLIGVFVSSTPVLAIGPGNGGGKGGNGGGGKGPGGHILLPPPSGRGPNSPPAVPEINPGAAASALTLAAGGTLIIADRLRRRDEPNADDRV